MLRFYQDSETEIQHIPSGQNISKIQSENSRDRDKIDYPTRHIVIYL